MTGVQTCALPIYYNSSGVLQHEQKEAGTAYEIKTEYLNRDAFGNPLKIKVSTPGDPSVKARETIFLYDNSGMYVAKETNPEGYVREAKYDPALGLLMAQKDIDGKWSYKDYDAFGKLTKETLKDGNIINYNTQWQTGTEIANALYYLQVSSTAAPTIKTYFDAFGRDIYVVKQGFNGTNIHIRKSYNSKGLLIEETLPKFGSVDAANVKSYEYEPLFNRIKKETVKTTNITSYSYDKLKTTTTFPDATTKITEMYPSGKVKSVTDSKGSAVTYTYHGNGEIYTAKAYNNIVSFEYTNGLKTSMTDPDAGTMTYTYDALGQLKTQLDGNQKTTSFTYDKLSRITTKTNTEGTTTYIYNTDGNGIGQLQSVTAPNNSQTYSYEENGYVQSITEVIKDRTFTTSLTYDSKGRVATKTANTGQQLNYFYNDYGYMYLVQNQANGTMTNVWQLNTKNAYNQTLTYGYGNGVNTTNTFDDFQLPSVL